ncbi:hypothetical protein N867_11685, partial [Actinotalea fermentans ATCC 43279 = JCM 9966 = DSM 3133]
TTSDPRDLDPRDVDPRDLDPRDLDEPAIHALPAEVADDRRPWGPGSGSGLWGAEEPDAGAPGDAEGQPRRVSVFGAAVTGAAFPARAWTPTTAVPTQVGEPVVPSRDEDAPTGESADIVHLDVVHLDVEPLDMGPLDMGLLGIRPVDLQRIDLQPTDLQPTDLQPTDLQPTDPQAVDEDTHEREPVQRDLPVIASTGAVPLPPPTLDDLMSTRPAPADGPAEWGWRAVVRRVSGGLLAPEPGPAERAERAAVAAVQRPLDGPRTIVVINPKGGAHKTTATLMLAATYGRLRGGYTLAWDNNETRGTLGWRSRHTHHTRTAVDLLEDLDRFADPSSSRVGDLDAYVRSQGSAQFDVLASDEDAASAASVDGFAFRALHRTLLRFYRLLVIDTGNNMRASNWQAAIEAADQVVVVSTMREDTAQSAAWALDALRATGHEEAVARAVTVLSQPAPRIDTELTARLHDHFGRLTRAVLEVPYEPALVSGGPIEVDNLSEATRRAWLRVAAAAADGL